MAGKKTRSLRCPTCRTLVLRENENFPFCSDRCRLIDLGKWASGGYVISTPITDPEQLENMAEEQSKNRPEEDSHSLGPETDVVDPQQAFLFEEQGRLLQNALDVLAPEERKAIESAFFGELTYEETAKKLNQPLGTVKTRIRSGLGKLREALGSKRDTR